MLYTVSAAQFKGFIWGWHDAQVQLENRPHGAVWKSPTAESFLVSRTASTVKGVTSVACYESDCADIWLVSPSFIGRGRPLWQFWLKSGRNQAAEDPFSRPSSFWLVYTKVLDQQKEMFIRSGPAWGGFCFAPPARWKVDAIVNCGCTVLYTVGLFVGYGHANIRGLICDLDWRRAFRIESIRGFGLCL